MGRKIAKLGIEKILDAALSGLKEAMGPFAKSTPGKMMIETGNMVKNKALDWIDGVKEEGKKKGQIADGNGTGPTYGNKLAEKVADKLNPDIILKVLDNMGKKNNYKVLESYMKETGISHRVTSALREGSRTESGTLSLHATGRAVDFAGKQASKDSQMLADIFWSLVPIAPYLAEIPIVTGKQIGRAHV